MSHFAKLDNNNIVTFVTVGRQEDDGKEQELYERTGDVYKQTSYNTRGGVHYNPETGEPSADQSKAFRKNYAGIGYTYDEERDAFIPPKPYDSWVLNEDTCLWDAPIPYPEDGEMYTWDEEQGDWTQITNETE
jgi:hypothetical protein